MTVEAFMKTLRPRLVARTPFLAYWHERGFMVLNTGVVEWEEYDVLIGDPQTVNDLEVHHAATAYQRDMIVQQARRNGQRIDKIKTRKRHRKVKASTVSKMRKTIDQLARDPRIRSLYTVEFDGGVLIKSGPDPDVLTSLCLPELTT